MALALHARGLFTWPEWAAMLTEEIRRAQAEGDPDTGETYYLHWLATLERIVAAKGVRPSHAGAYATRGTTPPTARRTARRSRSSRAIFPTDARRHFPTMLKIGISACFFHEDPQRAIFKGMTLQYIEQNVAHWLMQRDVLAFMVPSPDGRTRRAGSKATVDAYAQELDGLVLMGGSDVCPETYGEKALKPEWNGDRIRDDYEIALLRAFVAQGKPVLGVCRGAQVINVAHGRHALPGHRHAGAGRAQPPQLGDLRARTATRRRSSPAAGSPGSIRGTTLVKTNSVHHQAVKDLGRDLVVEAWSEPDRIVEAMRWTRARRTCSACSGIRSSTRPATPRSSTTRRSSTISSPPRRGTRPPPYAALSRTPPPMKISNPATGAVLADVAADNAAAVRRKYERARAAQPTWAARADQQAPRRDRDVPRAHRRAAGDAGAHADARGRQADPPVAQRVERPARRASTSSSPRPTRALRDEKVFADAGAEARGAHRARAAGRRSPTSRRGTIRISSAATCSCRRWSPATRCSTSRPSSRR